MTPESRSSDAVGVVRVLGADTVVALLAEMAPRSIHHLGVAVDDLDAAIARYGSLFGATLEHRETLAEQGVEAASLLVGASRVELLRAARRGHAGRQVPRRAAGRGCTTSHSRWQTSPQSSPGSQQTASS